MNYIDIDSLNKSDIPVDKDSGDFIYCQRQFSENRSFSFFGKEKITSSADVAFIMKGLESYGVEHAFAVYVLRDKSPVVHHLSMGNFDSCAFNYDAIQYTAMRLDAEQVYMVHNHPSGNLVFSMADIRVYDTLYDMLQEKFAGSIVINTTSGKYGIDVPHKRHVILEHQQPDVDSLVPMQILEFDRHVFHKDYDFSGQVFDTPGKVAAFCSSQRFGQRKKGAVLVLNSAGLAVANIQLPFSEIKAATIPAMARYIERCTVACGGMSVIPCFTDNIPQEVIRELYVEFNRISDMRMLDICYDIRNKAKSALEHDIINPNKRRKGMRL